MLVSVQAASTRVPWRPRSQPTSPPQPPLQLRLRRVLLPPRQGLRAGTRLQVRRAATSRLPSHRGEHVQRYLFCGPADSGSAAATRSQAAGLLQGVYRAVQMPFRNMRLAYHMRSYSQHTQYTWQDLAGAAAQINELWQVRSPPSPPGPGERDSPVQIASHTS